MNPSITTIQSIIQKCMQHQEMCFMERPLLYRQTNDYEQQEKIRKKHIINIIFIIYTIILFYLIR